MISMAKTITAIILLVLLMIGLSSFYVVNEGQEALLLRLGNLEKNNSGQAEIMYPGLHFKIPFVDETRLFDMRIQTLDIQSARIVTQEKKYVLVDYYVKWRIDNLPLFFNRTNNDYQLAGNLLRQQLNDSLRAQFGQRNVSAVVGTDRSKIMDVLLHQANITANTMGIRVIDVRIKKIELPAAVMNTVFQQMRADRERIAAEHRALGKAKVEEIRAQADASATITLAKAEAQAAQLRAEGDKQAAAIYANAYSKDPAFYAFYRSLLAYKQSLANPQDILVLKPTNQFFKYFNESGTTQEKRKT